MNYVGYLEETYLIETVKLYGRKAWERTRLGKGYAVDMGIANHFKGFGPDENRRGRALENIVFLQTAADFHSRRNVEAAMPFDEQLDVLSGRLRDLFDALHGLVQIMLRNLLPRLAEGIPLAAWELQFLQNLRLFREFVRRLRR